MRVHIRLLGTFEVRVDGRPVPTQSWRRRSAAHLVKLLSLQPGRRLRREQVVDALWPDLLLEEAAPRLHAAAHYARAALGSRDAVVLTGGVVTLLPDADVTVDVDEFVRAADQARVNGEAAAAEDALARYAGVLLPDDLYEPWTEDQRERLRVRHQALLRAAGRFEDLVAADPLDEEAQLSLAEDHLRHGRRQQALQSLDLMADLFRRELAVDPGPVAVALRQRAVALPVEPVVPAQRSAPRDRARSRLPAARGRLIGRDSDLATVTELMRRHRVVTVAGPGGAGKSTLAVAVARVFHPGDDATTDADVVLAELAPVRDPADVTRAVAEAAGVQGEGAVDTDVLAANLGPRPVLLVLDNCEHLLDAAAMLVDAILDAGDRARVLVTSREPLRVDGEAVHRLGSLGGSSAELFVERADAAAGPGAADAGDPRVVDLCERLDGLPLAIELAAAQLGHLSLQELVDRLDDRLTLLVGGRPKAGPRHSALSTTIEWSYRLLSDSSRDLFDRLGVFPSTFDLGAVEAVAGGRDVPVVGLIGDLLGKSLVVHDPARGRYRLLETIRIFSARRLADSGLLEDATERLRRHVARRATALPRVRTWLSASVAAQSRDDLENVRLAFDASLARGDLTAAVDIALGLSTLWRNAVSYAEGRRWVATLRAQELSPPDLLWTLVLAADVGLGSGDPRMMRDAAEAATAVASEVDDPDASALVGIYHAMVNLRRPAVAAPQLEAAAARARAADEPGLERLARAFRVVALRMAGHADRLAAEADLLVETEQGSDYDRYLCLWAASLIALVDRDGPRLRRLMDAQLADLMANGLRENWLTMYWQALASIGGREEYLSQLRRARRRAEAEGRSASADCVLALAYDAACGDRWERAATLLGASRKALQQDTASFIHLTLLRDQLVAPHLPADMLASALAQGEALDPETVLSDHGL